MNLQLIYTLSIIAMCMGRRVHEAHATLEADTSLHSTSGPACDRDSMMNPGDNLCEVKKDTVQDCMTSALQMLFPDAQITNPEGEPLGIGGTSEVKVFNLKTADKEFQVAAKVGAQTHYLAGPDDKYQDRVLGDADLFENWGYDRTNVSSPSELFGLAWKNEFQMQTKGSKLGLAPEAFGVAQCVTEMQLEEVGCRDQGDPRCSEAEAKCGESYQEVDSESACCAKKSCLEEAGLGDDTWVEFIDEFKIGGFKVGQNTHKPAAKIGLLFMEAHISGGQAASTLREALDSTIECTLTHAAPFGLHTCLKQTEMRPCPPSKLIRSAFCATEMTFENGQQELWDLHLDNFLVDDDSCSVKIIDYGAARPRSDKSTTFLTHQHYFVKELLQRTTNHHDSSYSYDLHEMNLLFELKEAGIITFKDSARKVPEAVCTR